MLPFALVYITPDAAVLQRSLSAAASHATSVPGAVARGLIPTPSGVYGVNPSPALLRACTAGAVCRSGRYDPAGAGLVRQAMTAPLPDHTTSLISDRLTLATLSAMLVLCLRRVIADTHPDDHYLALGHGYDVRGFTVQIDHRLARLARHEESGGRTDLGVPDALVAYTTGPQDRGLGPRIGALLDWVMTGELREVVHG